MSHVHAAMLKTTLSAIAAPHNGNGKQNNNNNNSNAMVAGGNASATTTTTTTMAMTRTNSSGSNSDTAQDTTYAHPFWYVCSSMPSSYWDYEHAQVDYNHHVEAYALLQKIGRGKYSEVFCGVNVHNGSLCVLKLLKPVRLRKIKREISLLRNLCGGPNIVRLLDVLCEPRSGTPVLVTEYVPNAVTLRALMVEGRLSNFDMRFYLYEVLRALDFAHRRGIFHRDIKPHNVMIQHERRLVRVIDWGLGEYYIHGEPLNCAVATRHYKAPELLLGYRHYDYSLDVWCVGCVLAGMLFRRDPFFAGSSNEDQLVQVTAVFGTEAVDRYVSKYGLTLSRKVQASLSSLRTSKVSWSKFIPSLPPSSATSSMSSSSPSSSSSSRSATSVVAATEWCDETALDLLDRMLRFDHAERIRADEAMRHPFFAPVRAVLGVDAQEQYPVQTPATTTTMTSSSNNNNNGSNSSGGGGVSRGTTANVS